MTEEFLEHCRRNHIVVVLRTPWCANSIQFEDLLNFWILKNAPDVGWYKAKQIEIQKQLGATCGASSTLSHARQLQILVPAWKQAFSMSTNLQAWHMVGKLHRLPPCCPSLLLKLPLTPSCVRSQGGFGPEGITMAPLWRQKAKDDCQEVVNRARSRRELKRAATTALGLKDEYDFDRWRAPWQRNTKELNKELTHEGQIHMEAEEAQRHSTRTMVSELQRLAVPATSDPARKLQIFQATLHVLVGTLPLV